MKKLSILLLAAVMLFTCFALAACGDDGDTSSPAANSSSAASGSDTSSKAETSSKTETSSEAATSSEETSSAEATSSEDDTTSADDTSSGDGDVNAEPSPFWITHYDDAEKEGAGMVLTESDTAGVWCDHYAFAPIDGVENGFELVALSYGTIADGNDADNGHGEKLDFPEGGFIYATSIGNDYPSLNMEGPNYVNDNCNEQISRCRKWKVGDKFVFEGLDLDGKTVPKSSGEDVMWYEDSYVCTATITPIA